MIILQLAVIFTFLGLGELMVWLLPMPVPSSILGMIMLTASLQLKIIDLRHVEGAADALVRNLGFFFIPAGVGVMKYFNLIAEQWEPIVGASAISTAIVIVVTGHFHQLARKYFSRHEQHSRK